MNNATQTQRLERYAAALRLERYAAWDAMMDTKSGSPERRKARAIWQKAKTRHIESVIEARNV